MNFTYLNRVFVLIGLLLGVLIGLILQYTFYQKIHREISGRQVVVEKQMVVVTPTATPSATIAPKTLLRAVSPTVKK